jgi:MscS family membrane protein
MNYHALIRTVCYAAVSALLVFYCSPAMALKPAEPAGPSVKSSTYFTILSSPRDTLQAFLATTDRAYDLIRDDGFNPENWAEIQRIVAQQMRMFDLRNVPPNYRKDTTNETAVYLREALARVTLPPLVEVPDADEMFARIKDGKPAAYVIPGTAIEIAYVEEGPYAHRFQFSADTVRHAEEIYRSWKAKPYVDKHIKGFYEALVLRAGPHIPDSFIRSLPAWMQQTFARETVWKWLFLIVSVVLYFVLILLVHVILKRVSTDRSLLYKSLILLLRPIAVIILTRILKYLIDVEFLIIGRVEEFAFLVCDTIVLIATVTIIIRLGAVAAELILKAKRLKESQSVDQHLVRLGVRILSIIAAVVIVIEGLQEIGFSLATVVAGASVTGLAVALAAQDTLKNIFGGLMLSLDKPFIRGQRVVMKGHDGEIEEIGLRSVKIRTLTGHQVTIPNEDAARIDIENIGRRPYIRRLFNVTITYDTLPEKIGRGIEILGEILAVPETTKAESAESSDQQQGEIHPNEAINQPEFPPRVYFNELNADSLNIIVIYWYHPAEYWNYLEHATWVNMQIMERFNAEGIDFAFPTQTLHLAGDEHRPLTVGQKWVSKEDTVSPSAIPAEAATPGVRTSGMAPPSRAFGPKPRAPGDLTDAPLEDEVLHADDSGEDGDEDDS